MALSIVGGLLGVIFLLYMYIRDSEKSRKIDRKAIIKENEATTLEKEKENQNRIYDLKLAHIRESLMTISNGFENVNDGISKNKFILRTSDYEISLDFEPVRPNLEILYSVVSWKALNYEVNYSFDVFAKFQVADLASRENILTEIKDLVYDANKKQGFHINPFKQFIKSHPIYLYDLDEYKNIEGNSVVYMYFNFGYGCSVDVSKTPVKVKVFEPAELDENLIHEVYDYYWRSGFDKNFILSHFRDRDFAVKN